MTQSGQILTVYLHLLSSDSIFAKQHIPSLPYVLDQILVQYQNDIPLIILYQPVSRTRRLFR